jgi:hydrogenase maturation protease
VRRLCRAHDLQTLKRVLLLGLGNDLLRDDAVGLHVAREVRRQLGALADVEVAESSEMGLALLDYIIGFREVVLVDAVQTGRAPPGSVQELGAEDLQSLSSVSPHFLGVGETLALGRLLGLAVPQRVHILAVEVEDALTMGTELTPALQAALPGIVARALAVARGLSGPS